MRPKLRPRAPERGLSTQEQDHLGTAKAQVRWRRRRDLNPREAVDLNPLSRRAP
jgi:hypothetical protein